MLLSAAPAATKFFSSSTTTPPPPSPSSAVVPDVQTNADGVQSTLSALPAKAFPAWPLGVPLAMHVHLTTSPYSPFSRQGKNEDLPHFVWDNITFGDWSDSRAVEYEIDIPEVIVLRFARTGIELNASPLSERAT